MSFGRTKERRREAARKHARQVRKCPRCGREIRGNAYSLHKAACKRRHAPADGDERSG